MLRLSRPTLLQALPTFKASARANKTSSSKPARVNAHAVSRRRHRSSLTRRVGPRAPAMTASRRRSLIKTPSPRPRALSLRHAATMASERPRSRRREHPSPSLMETSRVDGVRKDAAAKPRMLCPQSTSGSSLCKRANNTEIRARSLGATVTVPRSAKNPWVGFFSSPCKSLGSFGSRGVS